MQIMIGLVKADKFLRGNLDMLFLWLRQLCRLKYDKLDERVDDEQSQSNQPPQANRLWNGLRHRLPPGQGCT